LLGSHAAALEETSKIMEQADTDKSGFIDYSEFLVASLNKTTLLSKQNLELAFKTFDRDGSGSISTEELKAVIGDAHINDAIWQEIVREVDEDSNGEVDINEFKEMMLKLF
jgi:calcium-dependent protein kinase